MAVVISHSAVSARKNAQIEHLSSETFISALRSPISQDEFNAAVFNEAESLEKKYADWSIRYTYLDSNTPFLDIARRSTDTGVFIRSSLILDEGTLGATFHPLKDRKFISHDQRDFFEVTFGGFKLQYGFLNTRFYDGSGDSKRPLVVIENILSLDSNATEFLRERAAHSPKSNELLNRVIDGLALLGEDIGHDDLHNFSLFSPTIPSQRIFSSFYELFSAPTPISNPHEHWSLNENRKRREDSLELLQLRNACDVAFEIIESAEDLIKSFGSDFDFEHKSNLYSYICGTTLFLLNHVLPLDPAHPWIGPIADRINSFGLSSNESFSNSSSGTHREKVLNYLRDYTFLRRSVEKLDRNKRIEDHLSYEVAIAMNQIPHTFDLDALSSSFESLRAKSDYRKDHVERVVERKLQVPRLIDVDELNLKSAVFSKSNSKVISQLGKNYVTSILDTPEKLPLEKISGVANSVLDAIPLYATTASDPKSRFAMIKAQIDTATESVLADSHKLSGVPIGTSSIRPTVVFTLWAMRPRDYIGKNPMSPALQNFVK